MSNQRDPSVAYGELLAKLEYLEPSAFAAREVRANRLRLKALMEALPRYRGPTISGDWIRRADVLALLEGEQP